MATPRPSTAEYLAPAFIDDVRKTVGTWAAPKSPLPRRTVPSSIYTEKPDSRTRRTEPSSIYTEESDSRSTSPTRTLEKKRAADIQLGAALHKVRTSVAPPSSAPSSSMVFAHAPSASAYVDSPAPRPSFTVPRQPSVPPPLRPSSAAPKQPSVPPPLGLLREAKEKARPALGATTRPVRAIGAVATPAIGAVKPLSGAAKLMPRGSICAAAPTPLVPRPPLEVPAPYPRAGAAARWKLHQSRLHAKGNIIAALRTSEAAAAVAATDGDGELTPVLSEEENVNKEVGGEVKSESPESLGFEIDADGAVADDGYESAEDSIDPLRFVIPKHEHCAEFVIKREPVDDAASAMHDLSSFCEAEADASLAFTILQYNHKRYIDT